MPSALFLASCDWFSSALDWSGTTVGSFVPRGFAAYGRFFHSPSQERVRWSEIAAANGRDLATELRYWTAANSGLASNDWLALQPTSDGPDVTHASVGRAPADLCVALREHLHTCTRTPHSIAMGVWEGFNSEEEPPDDVLCTLELPFQRNYLMKERSLDELLTSFGNSRWGLERPNIWWPDDRSWAVATEIDFAWTYVGGSRELMLRLTEDERLDGLEVRWEHDAWAV